MMKILPFTMIIWGTQEWELAQGILQNNNNKKGIKDLCFDSNNPYIKWIILTP